MDQKTLRDENRTSERQRIGLRGEYIEDGEFSYIHGLIKQAKRGGTQQVTDSLKRRTLGGRNKRDGK